MLKVKLRFEKIVNQGDILPRGYGVAYEDPYHQQVVLNPIPINVLVRFCRWGWIKLKFPYFIPNGIEELEYAAFQRGLSVNKWTKTDDGMI